MFRKSYLGFKALCGDHHPLTLQVWGNMAFTRMELGHVDEGEGIFREIVEVYRNSSNGGKNIVHCNAEGNLGTCLLRSQNDTKRREGMVLVENAVRDLREIFELGDTHPWILKFQSVLESSGMNRTQT
mmetsp:Transcript_20513/g.39554  ORF Transcript_20513/g.39554 Transcript_20513/m.39554 type:complete len:128 (-) Transcript_20513:116-499(-)